MSEPAITFTVVVVLAVATLVWLFWTLVRNLEKSIQERAKTAAADAEAVARGEAIGEPAADTPASSGPLNLPAADGMSDVAERLETPAEPENPPESAEAETPELQNTQTTKKKDQ